MPSIELHFGDQDLGKYKVVKPITIIGRDPTADVVIDNLGISRHHCHIEKRGPVYVVKDLESSNGTFVGGAKVAEHNLNDGDEITIGKYRLIFHYTESEGTEAKAGAGPATPVAASAPDTLQTYVMDGKAIRSQLKEMERRSGMAESGGPMSAAEHAAMLDPLKPRGITVTSTYKKDEGGYKALLIMSLVLNFLLLVGMLVFGVLVVRQVWKQNNPATESTENPAGEGNGGKSGSSDKNDFSGTGLLIPGE